MEEIRRKDYVEPSKNFKETLNSVIGVWIVTNLIILLITFIYSYFHNDYVLSGIFDYNLFVMIFMGIISTFKGYFVDGHFLHGSHHLMTMTFFLASIYYPHKQENDENENQNEDRGIKIIYLKPFLDYLVYLTTRFVKRFYDSKIMTKNQWIVYYTCYSYVQSLVLWHSIFIEDYYDHILKTQNMKVIFKIWWLGSLPLCDNLVTLRSQNLSEKWFGQYFWKGFNNIEEFVNNCYDLSYANVDWVKDDDEFIIDNVNLRNKNALTQFKRFVLPWADNLTFWTLLILCTISAYLKNTYSSCLLVLSLPILVDYGLRNIKWFSKFERPFFCAGVNNDGKSNRSIISFPSNHVALATLFIMINIDFNIITRIVIWLFVCFYRLFARAHTLEDVLAGTFFAYFFHNLILKL